VTTTRLRQIAQPLTWCDILWSHRCSACEAEKISTHGLARPFCDKHMAALRPRLAVHLDRALHSRWFLAYWRQSMTDIRTLKFARAQEYNKPRPERKTA
jgi:hypothetical protein